jgi:hypothetical protein
MLLGSLGNKSNRKWILCRHTNRTGVDYGREGDHAPLSALRMVTGKFLVSAASIESHGLVRRWPFVADWPAMIQLSIL